MSKLYNKSRVLGCKNPQKAGNSPQTGRKMVLPAQECENLETATCSTQLATPFAAPAQGVAGVKLDNGAVEQGAAVEKLDNAAPAQSAAGVKSAKKYSKVLRAVACGCLAILMCGTAFLGTACGSTPANVGLNGGGAGGSAAVVGAGGSAASMNAGLSAGAEQNFATQSGGLITPRADDPVLFETKDGLEIKSAQLPNLALSNSGNLSGFAYFTTSAGGTTYTWVIIGHGAYNEHSSPAGSVILNEMQKQETIFGKYSEEIPDECVLVLANNVVASGVYEKTYLFKYYGDYTNSYYDCSWSTGMGSLMQGYYNNSSFGLSAVKNKIVEVTLQTSYLQFWETYYSPGSAITTATDNAKLFILTSSVCEGNFKSSTYLTDQQLCLSNSTQWLRGIQNRNLGGSGVIVTFQFVGSGAYLDVLPLCYILNSNGNLSLPLCTESHGYRPAFVMSIF